MGVSKRRLILLLVIVLVVVMIRIPTADAAVDEWLYVHTDGNDFTDWTEVGTTPFVDAQDEPTNYGHVSSSNKNWGHFEVDDTTGTGTVNSVNLTVYVDSGTEKIDFYIWDNSGAAFVVVGSDQQSAGYHYVTVDLISWITSVAEIDAIEIYFRSRNVGGWGDPVKADYAAIGVNVDAAGTDYTAYPDGDFTMGGTTALAASFSKTLVEGFALAGVTVLAAAFVLTLIQGFTLVGGTAIAGLYSKTLVEGFALAGSTTVFVIIQILIVEGFALTGGVSVAAAFVVTLVQGFALGGTVVLAVAFVVTLAQGLSLGGSVTVAVAYVKTLVEGFSLSGTVSALKVLIVTLQESFLVGVGSTITTIAGVASMIYLLFFSVEMWGYLGPMAIIIGGYFVMTKDKNLGVVWFVVECLIMAQYFALVEATPEYWWHIIILLIGGLSTVAYSLGKR